MGLTHESGETMQEIGEVEHGLGGIGRVSSGRSQTPRGYQFRINVDQTLGGAEHSPTVASALDMLQHSQGT